MLSNCPTLQDLAPTNYVVVNRADAESKGLHDGQKVKVVSPTNHALGVLRVREGVARGTVLFISVTANGSTAGALIQSAAKRSREIPLVRRV